MKINKSELFFEGENDKKNYQDKDSTYRHGSSSYGGLVEKR